jgi:hypothetical protein
MNFDIVVHQSRIHVEAIHKSAEGSNYIVYDIDCKAKHYDADMLAGDGEFCVCLSATEHTLYALPGGEFDFSRVTFTLPDAGDEATWHQMVECSKYGTRVIFWKEGMWEGEFVWWDNEPSSKD